MYCQYFDLSFKFISITLSLYKWRSNFIYMSNIKHIRRPNVLKIYWKTSVSLISPT